MENFTPINQKGKQIKKINKKSFFLITFLTLLILGVTSYSVYISSLKPKVTKPKAVGINNKILMKVTGRNCGGVIEGLCINWTENTNSSGNIAKATIVFTVADDHDGNYINHIWVKKFQFGCRGIKTYPNHEPGDAIVYCPDADAGIPAEDYHDEVVGPLTIEKGHPQTIHLEQPVDTNGTCGSAQVDMLVAQVNPGPPVDSDWPTAGYWGVAYAVDESGNPLPCVSPTETPIPPTETPIPTSPPGEPTYTPVPTNTPTPPNAPSVTPSVTPSSTPTPRACHQVCGYTSQCQTGLECRADWCPDGQNCNPVLECTNPTCPKTTADDCSCPAEPSYTPTPTPTNTPTPTPTNTPTPTEVPVNSPTPTEIILAQNTPTSQPQAAAPVVTEIPSAGVPIYLKIFSGLSLGILLLGLLF